MDGDPAVEPELDSFSLTFPLPYRVAFIIVLAVWGWGANLHYLYLQKIDVPALIRYPARSSPAQPPHHAAAYRLAAAASAALALSLAAFWALTRRDPRRVLDYDWLPMAYLLFLALLFVVPLRRLTPAHGGRGRFLATLRRVAVGGLAEAHHGKFGDILLADVLTSYAKVLGDLFVCLCMFFLSDRPDAAATARPDRGCGGAVVVPLIMAYPSLVRLRQCLIEFVRVRRAPYKEGTGWGGQHLANAAKYASAFPVIVFSALQRSAQAAAASSPSSSSGADSSSPPPPASAVSPTLYRAWLAAMLLNSLYSFYWDVAKDWDLTLFSPARERAAPDHAWGLRRRLLVFPSLPLAYYLVAALDLVLRCTWSLRLSPHLDRVADFEGSVFVLELCEVLRRWVWIFFRVETEWIRSTGGGGGSLSGGGLLGQEEAVLLSDFPNKYEDED